MDPETAAAPETTEAPKPAEPKASRADKKPETLADAMRRLGGENVFSGEEPTKEEPTETEADTKPEGNEKPKKKAPKREVTPEPKSEGEIEKLKQLATQLGMVVEDGKVITEERVKLREDRRQNIAAIKQAEAQAKNRIDAAIQDAEPKIKRAVELEAALKAGDYDGIGKVLGFKDWNDLAEDQLKRFSDPAHVRLREIEAQLKKRDEEAEQAKKAAEEQQASQAELAARAQYKQQLAGKMEQSGDPLVKAMSKMPNFVSAVFGVQQQTYRSEGQPLNPEHAIHYKPPGGGPTLHEELKSLYDALAPVFGKPAAETEPAGTVAKPKPKTPQLPPASPQKKATPGSDREWFADAHRRLAEAENEDRRNRSNGNARGY